MQQRGEQRRQIKEAVRRILRQAGRVIPPIARLHDHRNALLQQVDDMEKQWARREQPAPPDPELARMRAELEYVRARLTHGHMIELDYACAPRVRTWRDASGANPYERMLAVGTSRYQDWLHSFALLQDHFIAISATEPTDERQPYWTNPWLPPLDAIALTGIIGRRNPRRYVEVGSGNSTKYVRRAITDLKLRTKITSIDPHPRVVIDELCDEVIREGLENIDLSIFSDLGEEDVVFIDNSHRSFQNSDVTVFFTEGLPRLKSGCIYGIHDVFLPNDYPQEWLSRYYNEQYLLMTYLLGGAGGDEIILPVHFVQCSPALLKILDPILEHPALGGAPGVGGGFWLHKA
jgi:hypothetical protein